MIVNIKQEAKDHLQQVILPFWQKLRDQKQGGYYGYMGFDLQIDAKAPKGCILNSRILWFFSSAYQLLGDENLLVYAKHAYAFVDRFWDEQEGGVYWSCAYDGTPLDTMKHTYAQSFAIYGLCAYAMATDDKLALQRAITLFELIEARMTDAMGYLEAFDRTFHPLDNAKLSDNPKLLAKGVVAEKTMNTMLHVLEAYTLLYKASGDARVKHRIQVLLSMLATQVYNRKENRLEVFFDPQMRSVFDMQSYGHDIEASWLIDLAAQTVLQGEALAEVERWTTELAQGVLARSFCEGSLLNENTEGENDPLRVWWVQAETMVGTINLWQKTQDEALMDVLTQEWEYIRHMLVDPRAGSEWYWCVSEAGEPCQKPIVEPWKCPYHNGRMCMEIMTRL